MNPLTLHPQSTVSLEQKYKYFQWKGNDFLSVNIQDMSIIPFQNFWLKGLDPSWSIVSFGYSIHGILEYPRNGGKITDKTEVLMTLCGKVDQANVF